MEYYWIKYEGEWTPGQPHTINKSGVPTRMFGVIGLEWEVEAEEVGPKLTPPE